MNSANVLNSRIMQRNEANSCEHIIQIIEFESTRVIKSQKPISAIISQRV